MKKINLTQGFEALVDDDDFVYLSQFKWNAETHKKSPIVYARRFDRKITPKAIYMHKVVMKINGLIDHINHDGLDNRKENLRACTKSNNQWNSRSFVGNSKFRGVYFDKSRNQWLAQIGWDNKKKTIGRFLNELDAAKAYNAEALILHGEFACINDFSEKACANA